MKKLIAEGKRAIGLLRARRLLNALGSAANGG
jgi:hypothetical protein